MVKVTQLFLQWYIYIYIYIYIWFQAITMDRKTSQIETNYSETNGWQINKQMLKDILTIMGKNIENIENQQSPGIVSRPEPSCSTTKLQQVENCQPPQSSLYRCNVEWEIKSSSLAKHRYCHYGSFESVTGIPICISTDTHKCKHLYVQGISIGSQSRCLWGC